MKEIKDIEMAQAARLLGVEKAALMAVAEVESGSHGGFLPSGLPVILFEGHIFWRELTKAGIDPTLHTKGNETILHKRWTKANYRGGQGEHLRLEQAARIDRTAALRSASWGAFQILGCNSALCGCLDVDEFVAKMSHSQATQLTLLVHFLLSSKLDKHLRSLDWATFARHYNGPSYATNKYDTRLAAAYDLARCANK